MGGEDVCLFYHKGVGEGDASIGYAFLDCNVLYEIDIVFVILT